MLSLQRQPLLTGPRQSALGVAEYTHASPLRLCKPSRDMRCPTFASAPWEAVAPSSKSLEAAMYEVALHMAAQQRQTTESGRKPVLSVRPVRTHVNVLIAGGSNYVGTLPYHKMTSDPSVRLATFSLFMNDESNPQLAKSSNVSDPHTVFVKDPSAWASTLSPMVAPEVGREMVYTFQDTPGQGASLDSFTHLACLEKFVIQQQERDYKMLGNCRGLDRSFVCGCLKHSPTVCIYILPPEGPSKADLLIMSVLSKRVAMLPVVTGATILAQGEQRSCQQMVSDVLLRPGRYVPGLQHIDVVNLTGGFDTALQPPLFLPNWTVKQVSEYLVMLLTTHQVYDLLDLAWIKYLGFCEEFEAADKDISKLQKHHHKDWSYLKAQPDHEGVSITESTLHGADHVTGHSSIGHPTNSDSQKVMSAVQPANTSNGSTKSLLGYVREFLIETFKLIMFMVVMCLCYSLVPGAVGVCYVCLGIVWCWLSWFRSSKD